MLKSLTEDDKRFIQVIEHLDDGKVRVYNIVDGHLGDDDDPFTTIEVSGYKDQKGNNHGNSSKT